MSACAAIYQKYPGSPAAYKYFILSHLDAFMGNMFYVIVFFNLICQEFLSFEFAERIFPIIRAENVCMTDSHFTPNFVVSFLTEKLSNHFVLPDNNR